MAGLSNMANLIKIKQSAVAAKVPTTGDLVLGELALNTYDGKLYAKKDNGTASVVQIGASTSSALPVTLFSGSVTNVSISNGSLPVLLFGGVTTVNVTVT
jgi:hypothetical protein